MYRGGEGQLSFILHRITGVGILVFLFGHVADTFLVGFGPDLYNHAMAIYRLPVIRVLEVLLAAAVLYHALNGLRIIIIDFWPAASRYQRAMFYAVGVVFLALFIPAAITMIRPLFH